MSDTDLTLRPARATDLSGVQQLLVDSGLPTVGVAEALESFVVAEFEGALVGVTGLEECDADYSLLRSAAIAPAWRGRGLDRQLVEQVIANAARRGTAALYLLTTTAEGYFPKFGFTTVARDSVPAAVRATAEFRGACPASATVMTRRLEPART